MTATSEIRCIILLGCLLPAVLLAQAGSGSVTVTATQSATASPDQAIYAVVVTSSLDKTLSDVLPSLAGLGLTAVSLTGLTSQTSGNTVTTPPAPAPGLQWSFQFVAPFSNQKATTAALAALQSSMAQNGSGLTLSYSLSGAEVSAQQTPACDFGALAANARTQAQALAATAGAGAGAIVGLTNNISNGVPLCSLTVRFALGAAFLQTQPNAITVSVSASNRLAPDQASIDIGVQTPLTAVLGEVTGALQAAGITGAAFSGAETVPAYGLNPLQSTQPTLGWVFSLTVPFPTLKTTLAQITAAQQSVPQQNPGFSVSFYLAGISSSQAQQPSSCPESTLVSAAQTQASKLAAAAGVNVGPVLALAKGVSPTAGLATTVAPAYLFGFGAFTTATTILSPPTTFCSTAVQFQLL